MKKASMTERLYYEDSYLTRFTARVADVRPHPSDPCRTGLVLARTAFYPTSGGQPHDIGVISGLPVADVTSEHDRVWHWLDCVPGDGRLPVRGAEVECEIDWPRRFDHMQQHCGQHVLSAAFLAEAGGQTVGFHLGREVVTIDIDRPDLDDAAVERAEELANRICWEDRPVVARFVSDVELARLPLRKPPKVAGPIRVVEVAGFDRSACGGTHPRRTGEIGLVKVLRTERYKGGTRVEFACGGRALRRFRQVVEATRDLGRLLSTELAGLPRAVQQLQARLEAATDEVARMRERLAAAEARDLRAAASSFGGAAFVVRRLSPGEDPAVLRIFGQALSRLPRTAALLGLPAGDGAAQLLLARSDDLAFHAGTLLREAVSAAGGRGGGSPALAQGGVPARELDATLERLAAAVRSALAQGIPAGVLPGGGETG